MLASTFNPAKEAGRAVASRARNTRRDAGVTERERETGSAITESTILLGYNPP
jgi:hypothetical protein